MWEATFEQDLAGLEAIIAEGIDLEAEAIRLQQLIRPYLRNAASRALYAMERDYAIETGLTVNADFIREILQAQEARFASDITQTSIRNIRDQIAEGIAAGETVEQIRERIAGYYDRQSQWRAGIAAQYETGTAYEAVREALATRAGKTHKRWETMRDERVEQICLSNEAAGTIPIGEPFPSGHTRPLAHPMCRCWLTYTAESGTE